MVIVVIDFERSAGGWWTISAKSSTSIGAVNNAVFISGRVCAPFVCFVIEPKSPSSSKFNVPGSSNDMQSEKAEIKMVFVYAKHTILVALSI